MCVFTSSQAHWHTIQPHIPSQQPTSSNAPFEVELDELCCIKQNKSSMCFYGDIPRTTKTSTGHFRRYKWACDDDSVYTVSVSVPVGVCVCVVTVPGTLRPISRSYRCYLTKPTQTLFSSFPSSSLLFCLVPWQTRGPGGPWPNRWDTHSWCLFLLLLLLLHVTSVAHCSQNTDFARIVSETESVSIFAWLHIIIGFIVALCKEIKTCEGRF